MTEADELRASDIMELYLNAGLDENSISRFTYHYLASVKWCCGIDTFMELSAVIHKLNISRIRRKGKIKVAFLNAFASVWACTMLYDILRASKSFEPYIIVAPFHNGTEDTIMETYTKTVNYFKENGYELIEGYDVVNGRQLTWRELGTPDIIVHQNPHYKSFREDFAIYNIPLKVLNIYIPYAFMANNDYRLQFNQMSHLLYWKIFCETKVQLRQFREHSDIGNTNVICSGYVKMDNFLDKSAKRDIKDIWKLPPGCNDGENIVKIIYAPHHSLFSGIFGYATFMDNYMFIYEIAKKYKDTTSWVFKPHPLLKMQTIKEGLFKNEQEFDDYTRMWDALTNAKTVGEEPYYDLFKTSDGMIFDSQSFRTEYLYVDKPSLYLKRKGHDYSQSFDELGLKVLGVLYSVDGDDYEGIQEYIERVLFCGEDSKKEERRALYEEYLDYYKYNGDRYGSEVIYEFLCEQFDR